MKLTISIAFILSSSWVWAQLGSILGSVQSKGEPTEFVNAAIVGLQKGASTNDDGKFLIPTLRNIELTAPYMHDGRFKTLEEVVEFYNSGVHQNSPNIDPIMTKSAKAFGLMLTPYEKQCLVKFLKSFTDTTFVNNPAYQNPL